MADDWWMELARRVTASERAYTELAAGCWESFDVVTATRYRGVAEGLEMARDHMLTIARDHREGGSDA